MEPHRTLPMEGFNPLVAITMAVDTDLLKVEAGAEVVILMVHKVHHVSVGLPHLKIQSSHSC